MAKIGFKSPDIFYEAEDKIDFDVLEITTKDRNLIFSIKKLLKAKEALNGKELSMHTQTSRIFSCKEKGFPEFNEAEIKILEAEIILCKILGIKELIFHLKQEKLDENEEKILKKLFKFAKKHGVEMIYESNGRFIGETCLDVLDRFPKLNYNLDLGHLNTAIGNKTLGMPLDDFIKKIRKRTVYIHTHNNNGLEDEHNSLDKGTLDWKHVLDMLNMKKIRKIIMELRTSEDIKETKKLLENYLKARKLM